MKIVEAVNSMIVNSNKITNVITGDNNKKEFFFLYNNKYKWSILITENDQYNIFLYPNEDSSIEELAGFDSFDGVNMVTYRSEDIKTKEATETFNELYQLLASKLGGADEILDDIINDLPF